MQFISVDDNSKNPKVSSADIRKNQNDFDQLFIIYKQPTFYFWRLRISKIKCMKSPIIPVGNIIVLCFFAFIAVNCKKSVDATTESPAVVSKNGKGPKNPP